MFIPLPILILVILYALALCFQNDRFNVVALFLGLVVLIFWII